MMTGMDDQGKSPQQHPRRHFIGSRASLVLIAFLGIIGYLLTTEHRAHLLQFLPWVFLLACPLMHVFMHGHHGHGRHKVDRDDGGRNR